MPELPEVETMVRGIRPHVTNRPIRDLAACANRCRPITIKPTLTRLRNRLIGKTFQAVRRLGKRVVLELSDGSSLTIEPRMTGLVLLADPPDVEHLRLRWDFEGSGDYDSFWFWDRRGLGTVTLYDPGALQARFGSGELGRDALEMSTDHWIESCGKSLREIKVLLLDQKTVAGIGNLYASEILHRARIHPSAPAKFLKSDALERLSDSVQYVLRKAIEYEGSTLGDGTYRNALNQSGRYQNEHRVYMRAGEICSVCQTEEIVRIVQSQRSTFYCPSCQPSPKRSRRKPVSGSRTSISSNRKIKT